MCRSKAEGGARCQQWRRLRSLTAEDITPKLSQGLPQVSWAGSVDISALWESYDHPVVGATVEFLARVKSQEPAITADVVAAIQAGGGGVHGLEFRVKSPQSLARKIRDRVKSARKYMARRRDRSVSQGELVGDVVAGLSDVVRYTCLSQDHDQVGAQAQEVVAELGARGWRLEEAEQSYVDGSTYKGLHTLWVTGCGQRVEVQFQSRCSQQVKDRAHVAYEVMRDASRSDAERVWAATLCRKEYEEIKMPLSLEGMRYLGGVEIRNKVYA